MLEREVLVSLMLLSVTCGSSEKGERLLSGHLHRVAKAAQAYCVIPQATHAFWRQRSA